MAERGRVLCVQVPDASVAGLAADDAHVGRFLAANRKYARHAR